MTYAQLSQLTTLQCVEIYDKYSTVEMAEIEGAMIDAWLVGRMLKNKLSGCNGCETCEHLNCKSNEQAI